MKKTVLLFLLAVSACSSAGPPPLPKPPKDAKVWDLNVGRWPGTARETTNDLIHEPTPPVSTQFTAGGP